MNEVLLKDGVKFNEYDYNKDEVGVFEPIVVEHIKDIFGMNCEYFPKKKLKTLADSRSVPDGFVIDSKNKKWYILELKLLCDDAINRISNQIVNYKNSIKNLNTKKEIYEAIKNNSLYDLIYNTNPEIIIIINTLKGKDGKKFKEIVEGIDENIKLIEFKTFTRREGIYAKEEEHIHLVEPLFDEKDSNFPKIDKGKPKQTKYTEDYHLKDKPDWIRQLYEKYKNAIQNIDNKIQINPQKQYIAFQLNKRIIAGIVIYKNYLNLFVNLKKGDLDNPKGLAEDVSHIGHWATGDYRIKITNDDDLQYIVDLVNQSYNKKI